MIRDGGLRFNPLASAEKNWFVKGRFPSEAPAAEVVRWACEDGDCINMVALIGTAAQDVLKSNNRPGIGTDVLNGIHNYFTRQGINYKILLPPTANDNSANFASFRASYFQALEAVRQMHDRFPRYRGMAFNDFLDGVSYALPNVVPGKRFPVVGVFSRSVLRQPNAQQLMNQYVQLGGIIDRIDTANYDIEAQLRGREELVDAIRNMSATRVKGIPDIFTKRYGDASLEELYQEKDPVSFKRKLFSYIPALPRGHYLWQRMIEALFIIAPSEGTPQDPRSFLSNIPFAQNVFEFQQCLLRELFEPVVLGFPSDREFDKLFDNFLCSLDDRNVLVLRWALYCAFVNGPKLAAILHPEFFTIERPVFVTPLNNAIARTRMFRYLDRDFQHYLLHHMSEFEQDWKKRLRDSKQFATLSEGLQLMYKMIGPGSESDPIFEMIQANSGREGYEQFLSQEITDQTLPPLDPITVQSSPVDADAVLPESLLTELGFRNISIEHRYDAGGWREFDLVGGVGDKLTVSIVGRINAEGEVAFLTPEEDGQHEDFKRQMRTVVRRYARELAALIETDAERDELEHYLLPIEEEQ